MTMTSYLAHAVFQDSYDQVSHAMSDAMGVLGFFPLSQDNRCTVSVGHGVNCTGLSKKISPWSHSHCVPSGSLQTPDSRRPSPSHHWACRAWCRSSRVPDWAPWRRHHCTTTDTDKVKVRKVNCAAAMCLKQDL